MTVRLGSWLLRFVTVLLAVLVAVFGGLQTAAAKRWLADRAGDLASTPGQHITFEGLAGIVPMTMSIARLEVADATGTWLTAEAIDLRWSPVALLGEVLQVDRLTVARIPVPSETGTMSEAVLPVLPALPIGVDWRALSVREVHVDPAVYGEAAILALSGKMQARAAGATIDLALEIARLDDSPGNAKLRLVYHPQNKSFDLDLDVNEPGGRIAASLLGGGGEPLPLAVKISGQGQLAHWHGTVSMEVGPDAKVDGTVALALDPNGAVGFDVQSTAVIDTLVPLGWRSAAAGTLRLNARGIWADNQLDLETASLTNAEMRITAAGAIDLDSLSLGLTINARVAELNRYSALIGTELAGALAIDGTLTGPILQPTAVLDLTVDQFVEPGVTAARLKGRASILFDAPLTTPATRVAFNSTGSLDGLQLADIGPANNAAIPTRIDWQAEGRVALDGSVIELPRVVLAGPGIAVDGDATLGLATGVTMQAGVTLTIADLSRFSAITGLDWQGRGTADATITITPSGTIRIGSAGALSNLVTAIPELDLLLGGVVDFAGEMVVDPNGRVELRNVAAHGAALHLSVNGALGPNGRPDALAFQATLPDLARLSEIAGLPLTGHGQIGGTLSGTLGTPRIELIAGISDVTIGTVRNVAVSSRITVTEMVDRIAGEALVRVWLSGQVIDADGGFALDDTSVRVTDLRLITDGTQITGNVIVPLTGGSVTGQLRGVVADLARAVPPEIMVMQGQAEFDVTLADRAGQQAVQLSAQGSGLRAAGVPGQLKTISIKLDGDLSRLTVDLVGTGEMNGPLRLSAGAVAVIDGSGIDIVFDKLDAEVQGIPLVLRAPARISMAGDTTQVRELDLAIADGRLTATGAIRAGMIDAVATLENLPVGLFLPAAGGRVQARAEISGAAPHPNGNLQVRLTDLRPSEPAAADIPPLDLSADGTWHDGRVDATATLGGLTGARMNARATVSLALDPATLAPVTPPDAPIDVAITGSADLASLSELLPLDAGRVAGRIDIAAQMTGSPFAPALGGTITLRDGLYENSPSGIVIAGLELDLTGTGNEVVLSRLVGSDGGDGRLSGSGQLRVDPQGTMPFNIQIAADEFQVIQQDDATAQASGAVRLSGDLDAARLVGQVMIRPAQIRIPEQLPVDIVTLEVTETGGPNMPPGDAPDKSKSGPMIALDLTVDLPGEIVVVGRGLNSHWNGALHIGGDVDTPVITSGINLVGAELRLLGRTFVLQTGKVTFRGNHPVDPDIAVRATAAVADHSITVDVTGRASQPQIALSSDPPLPEDEVVAFLLFGQSANELTAVQALLIADGVATLKGGSSGGNVFDRLRKTVCVDYLSVKTDENDFANSTLSVGTYLRHNVLLSVEQGLGSHMSRAKVEVELTPNISVETELGATGRSGIAVNMKIDY